MAVARSGLDLEHVRQTVEVAPAILIGEDVKQPAIDHGSESRVPLGKRECVLNQKLYIERLLLRFGSCPADRFLCKINAGNPMVSGEEQGGIPRTATSVEDRTSDAISDRDKWLLRSADIPRRFARIGLCEGSVVRHVIHKYKLGNDAGGVLAPGDGTDDEGGQDAQAAGHAVRLAAGHQPGDEGREGAGQVGG